MSVGHYHLISNSLCVWLFLDPGEGWFLLFFSCEVVFNSLQPHAVQCPWLPCLSLSPMVCSKSCPLSPWCHPTILSSVTPSPSVLSLSQHQGLFQWVGFSNQVDKILELQLQHQSFQWIFGVDFLEDWLVWSPCCPRDSPAPQFESIYWFIALKKKNEDLAPFLSLVPPNICTFPSSHAPKLFKGCPYSSSFTSDIASIHLREGSSMASEPLVQVALPGSARLSSGDLSAASVGTPLASLLGWVSCFWYYILSVFGFILKFGWRHCQQSPEKWGMGYKFFETLPSFIIFPQHFEGIILLPSSCWNYFQKSEISNS